MCYHTNLSSVFGVYCATLILSQPSLTMIEQIFEFIGNNFILAGIFVALVVAFVINEGKQGGSSISTVNLVSLVNRLRR